ncbi:hypothetical protein YC2023_037525 [Brassica napus]
MNFQTGAVKAVGLNRQVMERLLGSILFEPTKIIHKYIDFGLQKDKKRRFFQNSAYFSDLVQIEMLGLHRTFNRRKSGRRGRVLGHGLH